MWVAWGIVTEGNDLLLCFQAEVEVVEQYSDPKDSKNKAYVEPGAETSLPTIYSKVNRNYCRPYTGKWCITFVFVSVLVTWWKFTALLARISPQKPTKRSLQAYKLLYCLPRLATYNAYLNVYKWLCKKW